MEGLCVTHLLMKDQMLLHEIVKQATGGQMRVKGETEMLIFKGGQILPYVIF